MKIQELLDSEDKWTQNALARDKNNQHVNYDSTDAVKWCLTGAIYRCYPREVYKVIKIIEDNVIDYISDFNDTHSYEEVTELVKRLDI